MNTARLLYGTTIPGYDMLSLDLLWRTGFQACDPFFLCDIEGKEAVLFISALEYERAKKTAKNCRVELDSTISSKVNPSFLIKGICGFLSEESVTSVIVPNSMPAFVFKELVGCGFLVICEEQIYSREIKSPYELENITEVQRKNEEVLWIACKIIKNSSIDSEGLLRNKDGSVLTAEALRDVLTMEFMKRKCVGYDTIIACGDQAVDPHALGFGPLRAHAPIVIDIYPRSSENWYFADMSRTFFKEEPSNDAARMYETVLEAQNLAINSILAGTDGFDIDKMVREFFESNSYYTGFKDNIMQGFFHGVGHGVGLNIHESPHISRTHCTLPEGSVVTVEPGLYYVGIGGVRIEDMVLVEKHGVKNLTSFPKGMDSAVIP